MKRFLFISVFTLSLISSESFSQSIYREGLEALENKNYKYALDLFQTYLQAHRDSVECYFQIGNAYFGMGQYTHAMTYYDTAKTKGFDDRSLYYNIGLIHLMNNEHTKALESFKQSHLRDGNFKQAVYQIAEISNMLGDYNTAHDYYELYLLIDPSDKTIYEKRAVTHLKLKDYPSAIIDYTNLLKTDSLNLRYLNEFALIYYYNRDTVSCYRIFGRALMIDSNYITTYKNLADVYMIENRPDDALACYLKLISIQSKSVPDVEIYRKLIQIYKLKGDYVRAEKNIDLSLALYPRNLDLVLDRVQIYLETGRDSLVSREIQFVLSQDTANSRAYMYNGIIFKSKNKYLEAVEELKKAVRLDAQNMQANYELGNTFFDMERFSEAINYYDKALKVSPTSYYILVNRGSSYYNLGFYRKAVEDFENAIRGDYSLKAKVTTLLQLAKAKGG